MPKFGTKKCQIWVFLTKNALFGYFWATIEKKLLSYLKSAPSNLSIYKNSRKNKNLEPDMSDLGIFRLEIEISIVKFK